MHDSVAQPTPQKSRLLWPKMDPYETPCAIRSFCRCARPLNGPKRYGFFSPTGGRRKFPPRDCIAIRATALFDLDPILLGRARKRLRVSTACAKKTVFGKQKYWPCFPGPNAGATARFCALERRSARSTPKWRDLSSENAKSSRAPCCRATRNSKLACTACPTRYRIVRCSTQQNGRIVPAHSLHNSGIVLA